MIRMVNRMNPVYDSCEYMLPIQSKRWVPIDPKHRVPIRLEYRVPFHDNEGRYMKERI